MGPLIARLTAFAGCILLQTSCGVPVSVSTLAVAEPHILAKRCKHDQDSLQTLSFMKSTNWVRITYDNDPCSIPQQGFGLQSSSGGELTIIPFAFEGDGRIPANIDTMIAQEQERGNYVIPVQNPHPGDVRQVISTFAAGHPDFQNTNRINIMMHGHGQAVRSEGQPSPIAGPTDTIISDAYYPRNPPNDVESLDAQTPRESYFSAQDVTRETLTTLQQTGISGNQTNCNLYVGSCQAGGVINGMRNDWGAWNRLGLDSAIGGSTADQLSYEHPTQRGPTEGLLGTFYDARSNPPPGLDANSDGVVTQGEFRNQYPGVSSGLSATVIGSDLAPRYDNPQISTQVTPIGQDPNSGETFYNHTTTQSQDFDYVGGADTPLFNVGPSW